MRKFLALFLLLFVCSVAFGQRETRGDTFKYLVEGDRSAVRESLTTQQVTMHSNLRPDHLIIDLTPAEAEAFKRHGYWIERAPSVLIEGRATIACQWHGPLQQTAGPGWDGEGRGAASITISFGPISWGTWPVPMTDARFKQLFFEQAAKWSGHIMLDVTEGGVYSDPRNLDVLVGDDLHGDGFGFNGALAHALPPYIYTEPRAGGTHFNSGFKWTDYATTNPWSNGWDIRHVMLHELGHSAVGLAHLGGDSVMGPYYNARLDLSPEDIFWAQQNYASRSGGGGASGGGVPRDDRGGTGPSPLTITATAPASTTTSPVSISGTITGGVAPYTITWTGSTSPASAFPISVNLIPGANNIAIVVTDSNGQTASVVVSITYGDGGRATR